MRRLWRTTLVCLVAIAALAVVWWASRSAPVPVTVQPAARRAVRAYVDERAVTRLPRRHVVSMPFDGRVGQIDVEEGDYVRAGQEVVRLVPRDVELDLALARAVVERMEAAVAENADLGLETTAQRQSEIVIEALRAMVTSAEKQVAAKDAWLAYYRSNLQRVRELATAAAGSQGEVELAQANLAATDAELAQQQSATNYQSLIYEAMRLLPQLILDYLHRKQLQGEVLRRQLDEATVALGQVELRRTRSALTSPVDGVVLEKRVFSEQHLPAGTTLVTIGSLQELEVEAEVLTQEAASIQVGDEVEVYGTAVGQEAGQGVRGRVKRVLPDAFTKISSLGVEEQRVKVLINLDDSAGLLQARPGLGVGFRVRVRIFTDARDAVIAVPRAALFRNDAGNWSLFVVQDGRTAQREVTVGLLSDEWAEVTAGLEESTPVVVAPESTLVAGARVVIRE